MTPEERIEASRAGLVAGERYTEQTFRDVARSAITVKLTPEVIQAFRGTIDTTTAKLTAAFRAAGFIVED